MSTWHQQKNPVQIWHATQWTVVTDPPNELMTVARFDTVEKAEEFSNNMRQRGVLHTYIVPPHR